jgi:hypothetical protein
MKLKLKQTKKVKTPNKSKLARFADQSGFAYEQYKTQTKELSQRTAELVEVIKRKAELEGSKKGNSHVIDGAQFRIGYREQEIFAIDDKMAEDLLPGSIFRKISKRTVDKDRFEKAVEDGEISRKDAAKIIVSKGKTKVIFAKSLKKVESDEAQD